MRFSSDTIFHPFLFSIYPVLFIYSQNVSEIHPSELFFPLAVTLTTGVCIWAGANFVLKNKTKAAFVASLSMIMLLLFKHFYMLFLSLTGLDLWRPHALIGWFVLYLAVVFVTCRAKRTLFTANRFANVLSLVLILLAFVDTILTLYPQHKSFSQQRELKLNRSDSDWTRKWSHSEELDRPDIYYIILDGYGRADALREVYEFDNSAFIDELRSRGFVIPEASTSNYSTTFHSIKSSLNMDYIHDKNVPHMYYSRLIRLMKSLGYTYVFIPSSFAFTNHSPLSDVTVDLGIWNQSQLSALLIEYSALWYFEPSTFLRNQGIKDGIFSLGWSGTAQWHRQITESIRAIGDIPKLPESTFTFAHIICPHPPFVFNRDGSLYLESKMADLANNFDETTWWGESELVTNQLIHLNRLLKAMVEELLAGSPSPPIIIIHGDHGSYARKPVGSEPSPEAIKERMSIFFAFHGPESIKGNLYSSITPVNIFRTIFNSHFGARFPLLPDKNIWSFGDSYREVTNVVGGEAQ